MEQIVRKLNYFYYGVMIVTLVILTLFWYMYSHAMYEPIDPLSLLGMVLQYAAIFSALVALPLGLYMIKWQKPQTPKKYQELATLRILMIGLIMPIGIAFFYLLGGYRPMMWLAAIGAIGWYFTKPTVGKMEQEMKPKDPNEETY